MNLNNTMEMMRKGHSGNTDLLLKIIVTLAEGTSFNRAWNIWVADPKSGDIYISFAKDNKIAFAIPIVYFNLFKLINNN